MIEAKAVTRGKSINRMRLGVKGKWWFCAIVATYPHYYKLSQWIIRELLLVWRCSDTDTNQTSPSYIRLLFLNSTFSWNIPTTIPTQNTLRSWRSGHTLSMQVMVQLLQWKLTHHSDMRNVISDMFSLSTNNISPSKCVSSRNIHHCEEVHIYCSHSGPIDVQAP